jgi:alanine-glyoxylate transaminase/serine-glyoxylate transaminase/serine-pyruvate transaminase
MSKDDTKRPLLMIPGPIEMDPRVIEACAAIGTSHVDPNFIKTFGRTLKNVKDVFLAPDGQPFVIAGSGSLGWDMFCANCLEDGDEVLVISQGYFGDSWEFYLANDGTKVTKVSAKAGSYVDLAEIKKLDLKKFKACVISHVDTSTAVRAPVQDVVKLLREANPEILVAVDSVAALGGEELRTTEWDIDFVMTGSQKALGVPAGLSISVARPRAIAAANNRKTPCRFSYVSWARWTPIMNNYMAEKGSYYATPAVSLIFALDVALGIYLDNGGSAARFEEHATIANGFRKALDVFGLKTVSEPALSGNTLSAIYYGEGVDGGKLIGDIKANNGAIVAGGIHKDCAAKYFRVGHMGYSVYGKKKEHVSRVINAIEFALSQQGKNIEKGAALAAFNAAVDKQ